MLDEGSELHSVYELASALERAEASARVLAARAASPSATQRAFASLAKVAPYGLVPTPGRGAAHLATQIERGADAAAGGRGLLGGEIVDAADWAARVVRQIASDSRSLDPGGVARAARRAVGTVRGLTAHTIERSSAWQTFRLGTYMPRAAWVCALVRAGANLAATDDPSEPWKVVTSIGGVTDAQAARLLGDTAVPLSIACALDESEAALVALDRSGQLAGAGLALARECQTRLRAVAHEGPMGAGLEETLERLLETLGALARAVDPRLAEPEVVPHLGLRRPPAGVQSPTLAASSSKTLHAGSGPARLAG